MKKIFFLFLILILVNKIAKAQNDVATPAPVGEAWKLTDEDANGMMSRLNECGILKPCHNNSKPKDYDNDEYKWIVATYGSTSNISIIDARYREDDQDRYKKLRGITDSKKFHVKGYKTKIVKVEPKLSKGAMAELAFYDCFTVCPPPEDSCD